MAEFEREKLSNRDKGLFLMRSITNYVMGVLLIGAGCFFLFPTDKTERYVNQYDPTMIKIFGILCVIYGIFRVYRGYNKNYFRER